MAAVHDRVRQLAGDYELLAHSQVLTDDQIDDLIVVNTYDAGSGNYQVNLLEVALEYTRATIYKDPDQYPSRAMEAKRREARLERTLLQPGADRFITDSINPTDVTATGEQLVRDLANQVASGLITIHNEGDVSHDNRIMPLVQSIQVIQQAIADLESEAGDLALIQAQFTQVTDAGVKLQLSKNGGMTWADVPGLHAMGLAEFHHVPSVPSWLDDGLIPSDWLSSGPRVDGGVLALNLSNGVYSTHWGLIRGVYYFGSNTPPSFTAGSGSVTILKPTAEGSAPVLYEYASNAWRRRFTFPDHRFHAGTTDPPSNLLGQNGEYYTLHDGTNALSLWLKNNNAWGKICDYGQGGGGTGGITASQARTIANERIGALISPRAFVTDTTPWGVTKLGEANVANRFLRSDGNMGVWTEVPNWVWQPDVRITAGKMGASAANSRVLRIVNNIPTWVADVTLVEALSANILNAIAESTSWLTNTLTGLERTVFTADELFPRFNSEQFEVENGVIALTDGGGSGDTISGVERVLNLQNLSTVRAAPSVVSSFELPAVTRGEQIKFIALFTVTTAGASDADIGPHRLSLSNTSPLTSTADGYIQDRDFQRANTPLDPDALGTYVVDGPEMTAFSSGVQTVYLHRTPDAAADADIRYDLQVFALRYKQSADGGGTTDYNDLTNAPFRNGDPRTDTTADDTKFYVFGTGINRKIWKPQITLGTDASWTTREYGQDDVAGGQTWEGYLNHYGDLGLGDNGDVRGIRFDRRTYVYSTAGLEPTWLVTSETFVGSTIFDSEAAALAAHIHNHDADDEGIADHYWWYNRAAGETWTDAKAYTVTDYTAGTQRHVLWVPYEFELSQDIHRLDARVTHVETDLLDGLTLERLTRAEYDALTDKDENTAYIITDETIDESGDTVVGPITWGNAVTITAATPITASQGVSAGVTVPAGKNTLYCMVRFDGGDEAYFTGAFPLEELLNKTAISALDGTVDIQSANRLDIDLGENRDVIFLHDGSRGIGVARSPVEWIRVGYS